VVYDFESPRIGEILVSDLRYETIKVEPGAGFDDTRTIEDETRLNDAVAGEPIFFNLLFYTPGSILLSVEFCNAFVRTPPMHREPDISTSRPFGPLIFPSG
jgi:hypothetical protein